jgi:hypothetical protein
LNGILGLDDKKQDSHLQHDESEDYNKISYVPSAMDRDKPKEPVLTRPRSRRENQYGTAQPNAPSPAYNNMAVSEYPPLAPTAGENRPPSRRNASSNQPRR